MEFDSECRLEGGDGRWPASSACGSHGSCQLNPLFTSETDALNYVSVLPLDQKWPPLYKCICDDGWHSAGDFLSAPYAYCHIQDAVMLGLWCLSCFLVIVMLCQFVRTLILYMRFRRTTEREKQQQRQRDEMGGNKKDTLFSRLYDTLVNILLNPTRRTLLAVFFVLLFFFLLSFVKVITNIRYFQGYAPTEMIGYDGTITTFYICSMMGYLLAGHCSSGIWLTSACAFYSKAEAAKFKVAFVKELWSVLVHDLSTYTLCVIIIILNAVGAGGAGNSYSPSNYTAVEVLLMIHFCFKGFAPGAVLWPDKRIALMVVGNMKTHVERSANLLNKNVQQSNAGERAVAVSTIGKPLTAPRGSGVSGSGPSNTLVESNALSSKPVTASVTVYVKQNSNSEKYRKASAEEQNTTLPGQLQTDTEVMELTSTNKNQMDGFSIQVVASSPSPMYSPAKEDVKNGMEPIASSKAGAGTGGDDADPLSRSDSPSLKGDDTSPDLMTSNATDDEVITINRPSVKPNRRLTMGFASGEIPADIKEAVANNKRLLRPAPARVLVPSGTSNTANNNRLLTTPSPNAALSAGSGGGRASPSYQPEVSTTSPKAGVGGGAQPTPTSPKQAATTAANQQQQDRQEQIGLFIKSLLKHTKTATVLALLYIFINSAFAFIPYMRPMVAYLIPLSITFALTTVKNLLITLTPTSGDTGNANAQTNASIANADLLSSNRRAREPESAIGRGVMSTTGTHTKRVSGGVPPRHRPQNSQNLQAPIIDTHHVSAFHSRVDSKRALMLQELASDDGVTAIDEPLAANAAQSSSPVMTFQRDRSPSPAIPADVPRDELDQV